MFRCFLLHFEMVSHLATNKAMLNQSHARRAVEYYTQSVSIMNPSGNEALMKVPPEFVVQNADYANPPTLFLAVESLIDRSVCAQCLRGFGKESCTQRIAPVSNTPPGSLLF